MLKEGDKLDIEHAGEREVLILILMEHAQRGCYCKINRQYIDKVLILILMEHAQREQNKQ